MFLPHVFTFRHHRLFLTFIRKESHTNGCEATGCSIVYRLLSAAGTYETLIITENQTNMEPVEEEVMMSEVRAAAVS